MLNGDEGKVLTFKCPKECVHFPDTEVWGDDIYSEDSAVCLAAIHRGVLTDMGGEVHIRIMGS
jgi:hypothetical protein